MDDGYSPITRAMLNYKMTYGEWDDTEVNEFVLSIDKAQSLKMFLQVMKFLIHENYLMILFIFSLPGIRQNILLEVFIVDENIICMSF